jgi:hypothetical protein
MLILVPTSLIFSKKERSHELENNLVANFEKAEGFGKS